MSSTLSVVIQDKGIAPYPSDLDPENPGADYGSLLPRVANQLDEIAKKLQIRTLESFLYMEPELLMMSIDVAEGDARKRLERRLENQIEWHEPKDAVAAITALLRYLESLSVEEAAKQYPSLQFGKSLQPVLWELRALLHVLQQAPARFRFEVL